MVVVGSAGNSADRPYITGSGVDVADAISVAQTHVPSAVAYASAGRSRRPRSPACTGTPTPSTGADHDRLQRHAQVRHPARLHGRGWAATRTPPASSHRPRRSHRPRCLRGQPQGRQRRRRRRTRRRHRQQRSQGAAPVAVLVRRAGHVHPGVRRATSSGSRYGNATQGRRWPRSGGRLRRRGGRHPAAAGHMVSTSSRGPSHSFVAIKPDIGAPGASVSAEAGTGTGETAFGGTSGAAPMVAGVGSPAARQAHPAASRREVKSVLMNTAETNILHEPVRSARRARTDHPDRRQARFASTRRSPSGTAAWAATDVGASALVRLPGGRQEDRAREDGHREELRELGPVVHDHAELPVRGRCRFRRRRRSTRRRASAVSRPKSTRRFDGRAPRSTRASCRSGPRSA